MQLNINSFRSAYISYWLPKLNKIQKDRVVAYMQTIEKMTELNYFKQFETDEKEEIIINETNPEQGTEIKIKTRQPRLTNEQTSRTKK